MATRRRRYRRARSPRVRFALLTYSLRRMMPPILLMIAYTVFSAQLVRWDMARMGEEVRPLGEELYGMYTQLFFEPTETLPKAPLARVVFWVTPLMGGLFIAQGLVKVGASLLDPKERRKVWVKMMSERMVDHTIVCGLGHVGFRVAEFLRKLEVPMVVIERDTSVFTETVDGWHVPVIRGDARRDELLVAAGIERAQAIVCCTNDDLVNLEVALDAKRMNAGLRVIMRMFDQRTATKVMGALDLDEVFSTSSVAAPLIALQATHPGVRGTYTLADGTTHVTVEVEIAREGLPLAELEEKFDLRVLGALDQQTGQLERKNGHLESGMRLLVDVNVFKLSDLEDFLAG